MVKQNKSGDMADAAWVAVVTVSPISFPLSKATMGTTKGDFITFLFSSFH